MHIIIPSRRSVVFILTALPFPAEPAPLWCGTFVFRYGASIAPFGAVVKRICTVWACSSVCRELFVKFVRFTENAIFRMFFGENLKKGLVILFETWYVVSNKGTALDTLASQSGLRSPRAPLF